MEILLFSLMSNEPHPLTGRSLSEQETFQNVLNQAALAEEKGFYGFGIGERHGSPFLSFFLLLQQ